MDIHICKNCTQWAKEILNEKSIVMENNIDTPVELAKKTAEEKAAMSGHLLRDYKGYTFYDLGQIEGGDPGDNKLIVRDPDLKDVHTLYFSMLKPENINKVIEKAKAWVNEFGKPLTAEELEDPVKPIKKKPAKKDKALQEERISEALDTPSQRTCRVCGCTDLDCSQCIEKTGVRCNWVEKDLCSACVPAQVTETRAPEQINSSINSNDMNFFQQLAAAGKVDLSLRIMQVNDKLTIGITPGPGSSKLPPLNFTGTPAELDEEFFKSIVSSVNEIKGIFSNAEEVKKQALEMVAKEAEEKKAEVKKPSTPAPRKKVPAKKTVKPPAKKAATKKAAPKKAAPKKQEPKKPAPKPAAPVKKDAPKKPAKEQVKKPEPAKAAPEETPAVEEMSLFDQG